jgi:hypothetical protein
VKSLIAQVLESMGAAAMVPFEATFANGTRSVRFHQSEHSIAVPITKTTVKRSLITHYWV